MIKKALEYIVGMSMPMFAEFHGEHYSDKQMYRIEKHIPIAKYLQLSTLQSLIEYIRFQVDPLPTEKMIVRVVSPTEVVFESQLNEQRNRETLVRVKADVPDFQFDYFQEKERFCIGVQSKFEDKGDKALLLKFAGTVEAGTVAEYGDDGITQKASVKTGIASKTDAIVPNPVTLFPYRTFTEVEQPLSQFVFRMKQDRNGDISCGLFEADGGAWNKAATDNIAAYLRENLKEFTNVYVIS